MRRLDTACAKIGRRDDPALFAMCLRTARFSSGNRRAALNEFHARTFPAVHVFQRWNGPLIAMKPAAILRDRCGEM
jgi:hypothetical protein